MSASPGPKVLPETYISVDVETSGSDPVHYAMISIGACLVDDPEVTFYVELKPDKTAVNDAALAVSGLSMEELAQTGLDPVDALERFERWVGEVVPADHRPVFTAFNAPFDWMFVHEYFHRYLGRNPFGHSALDIKAYAMGMDDTTWAETSMRVLSPKYLTGRPLSHNALNDAQDQAELFRALRAENAAEHRRG